MVTLHFVFSPENSGILKWVHHLICLFVFFFFKDLLLKVCLLFFFFFNLYEISKCAVPNDRTVSKELGQIQHWQPIRTELSDKLHSRRVNSLEELCGIRVILKTSRSCFNCRLISREYFKSEINKPGWRCWK